MPDYFKLSPECLEHQNHYLERLEASDPRLALQARLEAGERLLVSIEQSLKAQPGDNHLLFIQQVHQQRRERLLSELRQLNLHADSRYGTLAVWVDQYIADHIPEAEPEVPLDAESLEQKKRFEAEIEAWQDMIQKVRLRLVNLPGDPNLMRLLAEHQGRLLRVQEQVRHLKGEPAESEGIIEKADRQMVNQDPNQENDPEQLRLQREILILQGMIEKTRERILKKPGLIHLKALIQGHEKRVLELKSRLNQLNP